MKKFILVVCMAVCCLAGFAQQKGDAAVGVTVGVAPFLGKGDNLTNFGLGVKAQYNVSNPLRLEADLEYWAIDHFKGATDFSANVQFLFNLAEVLYIYPTVGVGYGHLNGEFESNNRLLINAGVGFEYRCSSKISSALEVKYQYMKDFQRLPISLGINYHF